jgi:hypothetical protein
MARVNPISLSLVGAAIVLIVLALKQPVPGSSSRNKSPLHSDRMIVQLGNVPCGEKKEFAYELYAHSQLSIVDVKSSCNCSVTSLSSFDLTKGETARLGVTWTIPNSPGPAEVNLCVVFKELDNSNRAVSLGTLVLAAQANARPLKSEKVR